MQDRQSPDFTRRPAARKRTRVLVSPGRRSDGEWSKTRIVWASFWIGTIAENYAEQLWRDNPDWIVEVRS